MRAPLLLAPSFDCISHPEWSRFQFSIHLRPVPSPKYCTLFKKMISFAFRDCWTPIKLTAHPTVPTSPRNCVRDTSPCVRAGRGSGGEIMTCSRLTSVPSGTRAVPWVSRVASDHRRQDSEGLRGLRRCFPVAHSKMSIRVKNKG